MSEPTEIRELQSQISHQIEVLDQLVTYLASYIAKRWRASLLDRVVVEVGDVRPRVLSDPSLERLDELRRFRHFKRYYYRIDYDPDKLAFLVKKTASFSSDDS